MICYESNIFNDKRIFNNDLCTTVDTSLYLRRSPFHGPALVKHSLKDVWVFTFDSCGQGFHQLQ